MKKEIAARIIQTAWIRYANRWFAVSLCHPNPYCGDWLCAGHCHKNCS